ncbi:radical SAM protein [Myxococcota bacterium]|nr:radical SAM protein [Myxococcota bacterium]
MKIFISYPPFDDKGSPMLTQNRQFQWMNVGSYLFPVVPATAATLLQAKGHDVVWHDGIVQKWDMARWWKQIEDEEPDLIAFESKTPVIMNHWQLVKEVKERSPRTLVVLMGDHATAEPLEQFENCPVDYVITGGGYDLCLAGIADFIEKGAPLPGGVYRREGEEVRKSGDFDLSYDLNQMPFIDRRLTMADLYFEKWRKRMPFYYTMAGRDCPRPRCTFCSWTTINPRFSVRTPENYLDELDYLVREHNVPEIFDDTGTFPSGSWRKKFCQGFMERGFTGKILFSSNERFDYVRDPRVPEMMKKAGWRKVKCGLESGNQKTLDMLDKGITVEDIVAGCRNLSRAGIDVHLTVMVGYPWETRDDAQRTLDLATELMARGYAEMLQSTVVMPYPGTPLHRYAVENGLFRIPPKAYDRYDMTEPVFKTPDMEPGEVVEMCQGIYKSFLTPQFVGRQLMRVRSTEDLDYVRRGATAVWGHLKDFGKDRITAIRA